MIPRMDDTSINKFIGLYKESECLWNNTAENYKSKDARKAALQKIADEMAIPGFSVLDVRKKIKSLRTAYYKDLRKMEDYHHRQMRMSASEGSTTTVYIPRNPWFPNMDSFLRPHIFTGRRKSQAAVDHRHSSRHVSDEHEVFGRYVAAHLRRLTSEQALRMQNEISTVLIGERLKNLTVITVKDAKSPEYEEAPKEIETN